MSTFSATRWNLVATVARRVVRLFSTLILARLLFPADFAVMSIGMIVIEFLDIFVDLGTSQALIQHKELNDELISSVFFLNVGISAILAIAILLLGPLAARISKLEPAGAVVQVLSFSTVIVGASLAKRALITREMDFRGLAMNTIGGSICYALVAIPSAYMGHGVWSLVAGHYAGVLYTTAAFWVREGWKPRWHFAWSDIQSVAHFSGHLAAYQVLSYFLRQAHKPIISRYLGADALGFFSMAERVIVQPCRALASALAGVLYARFSKLQDDDEQLARGFVRATSGLALIIVPIMVGLGLVSDPLVRVLFDERWRSLDRLIAALAPSGIFFSFLFVCNSLYYSKRRADLLLRWGMTHAGLTLAAYVIGLRFGLVGLAACYSAAIAVLSIPTFAIPLSLIHSNVGVVLRALRPHALAALAMVPCTLAPQWIAIRLGWPALLELAASILAGAAAFSAVIWITKPPALADLSKLLRPKA
jgi:PST family polysaccharide transporter